ncbi:MAG: MFS transporter [Chloroflexi bacterium]|nr:MFS transporter [Chloroflexota bacterium]
MDRSISSASEPPGEEDAAAGRVSAERLSRLLRPLGRIRTFEALQFREFRLLWSARSCNSISFWMEQVASGWLMYELTNSPLQLGLVQAIRAVPLLVLSPLAGTLADRYGRKTQLITAQLIQAITVGILGSLIVSGRVEPGHVYAASLIGAVTQVFQHPAQLAMIPETVDRQYLTNAIGLNSISFNASRSVGPAVAGGLIALVGVGGPYLLQASILALSTVWTVLLRIPNRPPQFAESHGIRPPSVFGSTVDGWRYVLTSETIRTGMLVAMVASLLGQPLSALLPVFARDVLVVGSIGQGFLLTGMGIGALSSGVLIASAGDSLPKGKLMIAGTVVLGFALIGFALAPWFALSFVFMVGLGVTNVASHALVQTVLQSHSAPEMRGRVMGAWQQNSVFMTIGGLLAGALASVWGAPWAVAVMGTACALGAMAILVAIPHVRTIR